ncbi:MAG TPA: type II secretion system protein GspM [Rhizomicrobium sp.]|jgi:hypothetical protein|nr:type II secretion system protein GspM [Rhizomicrobium sp.]
MTVPGILRGRHGAFIALWICIFLIAIVIGLPILAIFQAQQSDIQQSLDELATYQAEQSQRGQLEAQLRALQQSARSVPGLVSGSSAALAQAQLQSGMKALIEHNGGSLLSAQLMPPTSAAGFDLVSISYDLTVPLSRIRTLLYAVESHTPFFFISDADLVMLSNWRPDNAEMPDPNLEVRWTVHAYRWNGTR